MELSLPGAKVRGNESSIIHYLMLFSDVISEDAIMLMSFKLYVTVLKCTNKLDMHHVLYLMCHVCYLCSKVFGVREAILCCSA